MNRDNFSKINWKKDIVDPVCLIHGMRRPKHDRGECLYCCLCFKPLAKEECHIRADGYREDVCEECAREEKEYGDILQARRLEEEVLDNAANRH